jgi:hypothetical protein
MITERVKAMLGACERGDPPFPPTVLYHENWLLRVVLDWFAQHGEPGGPLTPTEGGSWFSEAWLPSAFLHRYRGDPLAESRTHADGILGQFEVGARGAVDLALNPDATQFVIVEAKLYGRLSAGVKNAPYFDQAARSVACMAETLRRADRPSEFLETLSLIVVAPGSRIAEGVFDRELTTGSIRAKVQRRAAAYGGMLDDWVRDWFEPTLERLEVRCLSWEDVIDHIAFCDPIDGQELDSFYGRCLDLHRRGRSRVSEAVGAAVGVAAGHAALGPGDFERPRPDLERPWPGG